MPDLPKNYLQIADDLIHGARNRAYGHPLDNHSRTAQMWGAYLGIVLTPEQVCDMNAIQKLSRNATGQDHADNDIDVAGYMGNKEMIREERLKRTRQAIQDDANGISSPRQLPPRRLQPVVDISSLGNPTKLDWGDKDKEPPSLP
jgi:hypothetical protein